MKVPDIKFIKDNHGRNTKDRDYSPKELFCKNRKKPLKNAPAKEQGPSAANVIMGVIGIGALLYGTYLIIEHRNKGLQNVRLANEERSEALHRKTNMKMDLTSATHAQEIQQMKAQIDKTVKRVDRLYNK